MKPPCGCQDPDGNYRCHRCGTLATKMFRREAEQGIRVHTCTDLKCIDARQREAAELAREALKESNE